MAVADSIAEEFWNRVFFETSGKNSRCGASILMRKWFLHPILALQELKARHDAVEKFLHVSNDGTVDQLKGSLLASKSLTRVYYL
jgi:DNA mismatch repair ATPase MutS